MSSLRAILPWTLDEGQEAFEAHHWEVTMFSWMSAGAPGSWLPTRGGSPVPSPLASWKETVPRPMEVRTPAFLSLHYATLSLLLHTSNNMQTSGSQAPRSCCGAGVRAPFPTTAELRTSAVETWGLSHVPRSLPRIWV